jgi:hypothetical protein
MKSYVLVIFFALSLRLCNSKRKIKKLIEKFFRYLLTVVKQNISRKKQKTLKSRKCYLIRKMIQMKGF